MSRKNWGVRNNRSTKPLRKDLRNLGTAAEAVLWKSLKRRQLLGKRFRRQHSIGRYIVDFYCPECRLVIELDGEGHYSPTGGRYEAERTRYLESLGLRVVRFENRELLENLEGVLETIKHGLGSDET
jgi:very-short-patch-repair endonuclease